MAEELIQSDDPLFLMLWKWFDERGAITRTERSDGLTVADFKTMLDEHEQALLDQIPAPAPQ